MGSITAITTITGILTNAGLGAIYYTKMAPRFSLLHQIGLKTQIGAFALAAAVQGFFTSLYPSKERSSFSRREEGFSRRKVLEILVPYLLIGASNSFFHRNAFKANMVSALVLGTLQLVATRVISPKISSYLISPDKCAFGKKEWARHFGVDVGNVPPFTQEIADALNKPCPFYPGKTVRDTHMLVLIPKTVDGEPFHLTKLQTLIQKKSRLPPFSIEAQVQVCLGHYGVEKSYWVLMTKEGVPNSDTIDWEMQKKIVTHCSDGEKQPQLIPDGYQLPRALEGATSLFAHFLKTENPPDDRISTFCKETIIERDKNGISKTNLLGIKWEGFDKKELRLANAYLITRDPRFRYNMMAVRDPK